MNVCRKFQEMKEQDMEVTTKQNINNPSMKLIGSKTLEVIHQ